MMNRQIKLRIMECCDRGLAACVDIHYQCFDRPELKAAYMLRIDEIKKQLRDLRRDVEADKNLIEL